MAISARILDDPAPEGDAVQFSDGVQAYLRSLDLSRPRFESGEIAPISSVEEANGDHTIIFGLSFPEETGRRLLAFVEARYTPNPKLIHVTTVEFFWTSPESPEFQARIIPRNTLSPSRPRASSYAQSVSLLGEITAAAIDPGSAESADGAYAVFFTDRVALDARVRVTYASSEDGDAIREVNAYRLDETGWPIIHIPADEVELGYLQIRYTPGSDRPRDEREEIVLGAWYTARF